MFRPDRLIRLRKNKGLTQEDLGNKINSTKGTISNYENGHSTPPSEALVLIANALNTTTDYLLGRTNEAHPDLSDSSKEQAEFEEFINDPEHGIFFKDYLKAPAERREEMRLIFKILQEKEKGRKPEDRQGE
ncbi:helix-turn-helix domain-containing protein [Paenibacillus chibensis]|uniref:helix-turn-helix domain-containing protein n=1 Tax=Paenibacillus chibensis TaxID=59846 RepID=UPI000FDC59CC|nr:helix-turn-helix transcriptional regulator [Paenibacillus chibensis]MEC0370853.1 helix-turn-helix transcriptional regulator [Paenibacillus chibensis]